jgi:antitoxin component YwqK of YwqJK toxin-antitoxin module
VDHFFIGEEVAEVPVETSSSEKEGRPTAVERKVSEGAAPARGKPPGEATGGLPVSPPAQVPPAGSGAEGSERGWREHRVSHPNGQPAEEGVYRWRKREGVWRSWSQEGVLIKEERYLDGALDGTAVTWFADGRKASEIEYRAGVPHGRYLTWYDDGQKREEGTCVDGKWEGEYSGWHPNGQLRVRSLYRAGEPEGPYTEWYPTGGKRAEGNFRAGKKEGYWYLWDQAGTISRTERYQEGVLISVTPP